MEKIGEIVNAFINRQISFLFVALIIGLVNIIWQKRELIIAVLRKNKEKKELKELLFQIKYLVLGLLIVVCSYIFIQSLNTLILPNQYINIVFQSTYSGIGNVLAVTVSMYAGFILIITAGSEWGKNCCKYLLVLCPVIIMFNFFLSLYLAKV